MSLETVTNSRNCGSVEDLLGVMTTIFLSREWDRGGGVGPEIAPF